VQVSGGDEFDQDVLKGGGGGGGGGKTNKGTKKKKNDASQIIPTDVAVTNFILVALLVLVLAGVQIDLVE
jgi:hypothetical protein